MNKCLKKIESFTVNHKLLVPGIYISRKDDVYGKTVTTFDIRVKRPNFEDCMQPAEAHTIEHLGATFFRNNDSISNNVIYFGPMGCLTGFYLILSGDYIVGTEEHKHVVQTIMDMFKFVVDYADRVPGTTPIECGNYRLHNLDGAKTLSANMLVLYDTFNCLLYEYPTEDNRHGIADSCSINSEVLHKSVLPHIDEDYYENECDKIDYEDIVEVDKSLDCTPEEIQKEIEDIERQINDDFIRCNADLFPEAYEELKKKDEEKHLEDTIKKINESDSDIIVVDNHLIDKLREKKVVSKKKTKKTNKKQIIDAVFVQDVVHDSSTLHTISRTEAIDKAKHMNIVADALF